MVEWKEYKLGEVCSRLRSGKGIKAEFVSNTGKYPVIGGNGVRGYTDSYNFEGQAAVIGRQGAYCGNVRFYEGQAHMTEHAVVVVGNKLADTYFLACLLSRMHLGNLSGQSAQPGISVQALSKQTLRLPSIEYQKQVSAVIKSLDDKIAVNKKICENLEAQAQALFKHWFVDFAPFKDGKFVESEFGLIPEGWRVISLDEMTSKFGTGLNPRQNFKLGEGNNYYVTIKNMGNNRVYLDDRCDKVTDEAIEKINKRSKLQKGDLLFSGIGTIGRVAMITETPTNWNTSESVFNMHPEEGYSTEFLYVLLLSDVFQQYVKIHAQGGVQQGIRMASLKQYQMAVPDYITRKAFDDILVPIISQIREKDKENDCLSTLRDTLLPKLMSGQIKVNEIEKSL